MTTTRPSLSTLTVTIRILEGRNLIAKDRNLLGKRSTSDTYVKVYSKSSETGTNFLGKTKVVPKTLNPVFTNANVFTVTLGADSTRQMLQQNGGGIQIVLHLFDHDKVGDDDAMGTVEIPVKFLGETPEPRWYPVTKGSGNTYCHNAKGELKVGIDMVAQQMRDVTRGQAIPIVNSHRIKVGLAWDIERGQQVDLDCSCVAVGRNGEILMDETVYYGNLQNQNHSIYHSGDETTGAALGDDEKIWLELDRIPPKVLCLYFLLTVAQDAQNHTLAQVKSAKVRVIDTQSRQGICRVVPHEFGANTALFLFRLSRNNGGGWLLTPMEQGDTYARDFGSLIPEIKGYTRDLIPNLHIDKTERVAVMRKGGTIRVADYLPPGAIPNQVTFGLAWDVTNGVNIDLDASAIMLGSDYNLVDLVSFSHLISNDGSIRHSGDEREGDEEGDDEKITVSLANVHPAVQYIGFVVNSYSRQELDDVDRAACHLFDTHTNRDIATYTLSNAKELDKHTALLMGCLYRGDDSGNANWYLRIISLPKQGTMAKDNIGDLQRFLQHNPPLPPSVPPPEPEIVLNSMPDATIEDEPEIDLSIPQSDFANYVEDEEIDLSAPIK